MRLVRGFLIVVGIWYVFNLVLTWPSVFNQFLPGMYPHLDVRTDTTMLGLLLDAWVIVGIQLAAIGVILLWGAQTPAAYYRILIPLVIVVELFDGGWDIYSTLYRGETPHVSAITLAIHAVIIIVGLVALRRAAAVPVVVAERDGFGRNLPA